MVELELHSHCGEAASESLAPICTFGHIPESPSHSHLAEGQAQTQKLPHLLLDAHLVRYRSELRITAHREVRTCYAVSLSSGKLANVLTH